MSFDAAQPLRIKLDFTEGVASKAATRISAMLRARAMESVFFMAFNVFAASADELHTALRNGTDYYKEAHRRAQIKILCNSAMPNAPFQNMHWDFPNFLSEHLAIGAFYPSNACVLCSRGAAHQREGPQWCAAAGLATVSSRSLQRDV